VRSNQQFRTEIGGLLVDAVRLTRALLRRSEPARGGAGKSLRFQVPAVLLPNTTIVVSPLIALMKGQVDDLTRRGIRVAAALVLRLYVAPERFAVVNKKGKVVRKKS
jgi:hypothetical protein